MIESKYAPIVIFAFNRLDSLKATVASVLRNTEAAESDLFVFVDGARPQKEGEKEKVLAVQEYVKTISGFKSVTYTFSDQNKGLGPSIIAGVTEVINKYGSVIVLEDDLILSENCLAFLHQSLLKYQDSEKVFSISGFSYKLKIPKEYKENTYFCVRSSSWGWATWADRWNSVDWFLDNWDFYKKKKTAFNKWGGSDCFEMLEGWKDGRNKSWAIRFCFNQFLQNKVTLFPVKSKINNDNSFAGEGTNCKKYSRFEFDFDDSEEKVFTFPNNVEVNSTIKKSYMKYHSLYRRLWSKIMYILDK